MRRVKIGALGAAALLLAVLVWHPFPPATAPGWLEMTAIDVGQGDSIFLAFPDGKRMLVDAGGIPSFGRRSMNRLNIGEDVVSPYLWSRSVRTLDAVALSHAHEDHIGGLAAVLANFHVREVWVGAMPESPEWTQFRTQATALSAKIVPLREGEGFDYSGAHVEVLAPLREYVTGDAPRNNDSLMIRISYGRRAFILGGDAEKQVEQALVTAGRIQPADVLKVGHHGSKTSSIAPFLDLVHPAFAVISDGFENSYGHPNPDVLARLTERGTETLRTDTSGLISIRTDGNRIQVETARAAH